MKKLIFLGILIFIVYSFAGNKTTIYEVKAGQTIYQIAKNLNDNGVIKFKYSLILLAKARAIKPKVGYYSFNNIWQFLTDINNAKVKNDLITLLPGKTIKHYYQLFKDNKYIKVDNSLSKIMQKLKIQNPFEGRFLPQTYKFNYGDNALSIFARSYKLMNKKLNKIWQNRDKNKFIKTKYQLLILASMVEKESGNKKENSKIAGVFLNRLAKNMRLQSDPTTIYGLGNKYSGVLTKQNLREKNLYNTYKIKGLPIGAIANPSLQTIIATSKSKKHNLLYFVAKNSKEHIFAKTYAQHKQNIKQWLKRK